VLPFRNLQPGPEDSYIADGVVEEIVHALAGLKELFVISRTSTLGFAGPTLDTRSVSRELGVRNVLHGSVRRYGEWLRIGAELSDPETGEVIASNQYDGRVSDLFELQTRVAVQVARTIVPQVHERELRRAMRKPPENRTAYDLLLEALRCLYRLDLEAHTRARDLLEKAICLDPDYALPYTYMAYWHIFRVGEGWSSDPSADAYEAARVAAAAIERDRNDALALAIFGHVQSFLMKDYASAIDHFDRAIEAGPNCALAWTMSSATYGYLGEGAIAVERAERGLSLSPLDAHVFWHEAILAQAYYVNGQHEQAVTWAKKAAGHNALAIFNLRTLAASLVALGRQEEARRCAERLIGVQPKFRLSEYGPLCPFTTPTIDLWIERLRQAGLPD
jgi:TolB-like protein/Tfp pilus assembly protein PilF